MRFIVPALILTGLLGASLDAGPLGWRSFHSPEGGFRVSLPGPPALLLRRVGPQPEAPVLRVYAATDHAAPYVASYLRLPHDAALGVDDQELLDIIQSQVSVSGKRTLLSARPFDLDGSRGREFRIRFSDGFVGLGRVIVLGDSIFSWVTQTNPGDKANPHAAQFMSSFQPDAQVLRSARQFRLEQASLARTLATEQTGGSGGWKKLRSARGGFSVEMPAFLRYGQAKVADPATFDAKTTIYSVIAPANRYRREVYIAGYAEGTALHGDESAEQWLDGFRNANTSHRGMRLTSSQDVTVNGYPGREYRYEDNAGFSEMTRVILADSRLYILTAIAPVERSYSDDTLRFLGSFKLSGAAKVPALTQRRPAPRRDTL
jgi:hypothetical protein